MESLTHAQITTMFLALGVLLATARLFGEIAKRFKQPAVIGEIFAGILLGPTIMGNLWPVASVTLFPAEGPNAVVLTSFATLAVVLFLLVAGMEVDLSTLFRLKHVALIIGAVSMVVPFSIGFGLGQIVPGFLGMEQDANKMVFSLFLGIALSICALPVIAKTLMDLKLYRTDVGMTIIASAIFHDVVGWIVFAMILGMMSPGAADGEGGGGVLGTIMLTLGFAGFMLTVGRWAIHRCLPWLQAHTGWPGGVLGFALALGLLGAAFTEWIGIHAIFGAFIVGVALGDSEHLRQQTRSTIDQFISFIFAPLFFASIGLQIDFFAHMDLLLILTVVAIACIGETSGAYLGARLAGFKPRPSLAMGFALNARGAMEIVLALLALQYGVIGERLFVALVVMALVTSLVAGPLMQFVLRRKQPARLRQHLSAKACLPGLSAESPWQAINALCEAVAPIAGVPKQALSDRVWERERTMATTLPGGLAIPHARIEGLSQPIVAIATIPEGLDWDAADGRRTRLVLMVLTPHDAYQIQLELLADIAHAFSKPETIASAVECDSFTCMLALINTTPEHESVPQPIPAPA